MTTEKELGEALKRGDSTIEVELDLLEYSSHKISMLGR